MKAAVFTINTRAYEQKKSSKTGAALKTTLEQIGFEVKEGVLPEDKTVVAEVILDRVTAGIRNKTIIVNLHEGQKSAKESLEYIIMELVQALETMNA